MRLAYLDPHTVPDTIPEALQVLQVAEAFAQAGTRVSLVTPGEDDRGARIPEILGRAPHLGLDVVHLRDRRKGLYRRSTRPFIQDALSWLASHPHDVVYVRNLKLAAALLDRAPRTPVVFETHELFARSFAEEHPRPNLAKRLKLARLTKLEGGVYRRSLAVVGLTEALIADIADFYRLQTPTFVAPDGVDLDLALKSSGGAPNNAEPVFLYLGSLHRWKGVETLIDAMPAVARGELRIAGGGDARIAELRARAESRGVGGRVRFLGAVPPLARFDVIAAADVCLLPLSHTSIGSRYTSPLKLFEYMAMGKPIIVADAPAIREVLTHGENGWLVPAEDPQALAAAIGQLAADAALRDHIGSAARTLAERYSWRARADGVLGFIADRLHG